MQVQRGGADLAFRRYSSTGARAIRADVQAIYEASYVDAIASVDPSDSVDAFMHRFDVYTASPTFDMVVAYLDGSPAGQTWGWPLTTEARETGWWAVVLDQPEPGFTEEDGHRTFALSEIMVRQDLAGRGIAHALHDGLLRARREQRATLLVEPDNITAWRAYQHWGWKPVSRLRPGWENAPLFEVFILPLPLSVDD